MFKKALLAIVYFGYLFDVLTHVVRAIGVSISEPLGARLIAVSDTMGTLPFLWIGIATWLYLFYLQMRDFEPDLKAKFDTFFRIIAPTWGLLGIAMIAVGMSLGPAAFYILIGLGILFFLYRDVSDKPTS